MDAKIITGLLLCFCLMASISISQSASANFDSRLRFRRQNDETDAGTTADEGIDNDAYYYDDPQDDKAKDDANPAPQPGNNGNADQAPQPGSNNDNADQNPQPDNNDDDNDAEDDPVDDDDGDAQAPITTTAATKSPAPKPANGAEGSPDDVEYYDEEDDADSNVKPNAPSDSDDKSGPATTPAPAPGPAPGPPGSVQLRVVVNPDVLTVQRGRTVELTCIVYGGDANTNIYWIQEQPERRYALTDVANENDKQVSAAQVTSRARITLDDPTKIGTYTCMAQDAAGNSGSAVLTMQEGYTGPVYPGLVPSGGSSRGKSVRRLDRGLLSDRWVFTMAPPFLVRASSMRSPRVASSAGEGTSASAATAAVVESPRPPV